MNKIIKFTGTHCPSCRKLEALLKMHKLEVDEEIVLDNNLELARKYQVSTLPTLLKIEGDKEIDRVIGIVPSQRIKEFFGECDDKTNSL